MGFTYRKSGGAWGDHVKNVYRKEAGVWRPARALFHHAGGSFKNVFQAEIVITITTNGVNLDLKSLFTSTEWTAAKPKRVIINPGVTISPSGWAQAVRIQDPLLLNPWGGTLTLDNYGTLQGNGGSGNSGTGGNVFYAGSYPFGSSKKLVINNFGIIRAGGGGGGRGGTGGGGYYYSTATDGPVYNHSSPLSQWTSQTGTGLNSAQWAGTSLFFNKGNSDPYVSGIYTYFRGTLQETASAGSYTDQFYSIYRQYQVTNYTSGGAFGNGGRGQGADGSNQGGTGGSAGGTNAGSGGAGGTGGGWGASGGTGSSGSAGNNGSGSAGLAGGVAGYAYTSTNHTMNNSGTIQGRVG